jgi:hypothetical protein
MEFRTFPASSATGLNAIGVSFANTSAVPFFRAHSTGGGLPNPPGAVNIDPDQETTAAGGYDIFGNPTPPLDNFFYVGQADFVVRVNRIHTIWFDSGGISAWAPAVTIPDVQPEGTQVVIAYRGATSVTGAFNDANLFDPYGDSTALTIFFHNGVQSWTTDINQLFGARAIQARITMISNTESLVSPILSGFGLSFDN